ncbi:hypothetical protein [Rhizobium sp. BK456]|uniref:hypothetical protein n=1 Tax=Rhizobium sp. BK456 TaxID=2587007 RepID=UPI00161E5548|nr:hypothetical protein [Rhizobium sp. BK456]MBB3523046.1 hypothetical protein [Rhizobium sp. BK456]
MRKTTMPAKVQDLVAAGLLAKFNRDLDNAFMEVGDKSTVDEIVQAAKLCGLAHYSLAGAYFVEMSYFNDSSRLKDEFDTSIQKHFGETYAMGFVRDLVNLEEASRKRPPSDLSGSIARQIR